VSVRPSLVVCLLTVACSQRSSSIAPEPAPVTVLAVPLDLPKASTSLEEVVAVVRVALARDEMWLNDKRLASDDELLPIAREALAANPEARTIILADKDVTYGRVIHAMDLMKQAGATKFAFGVQLSEPPPALVDAGTAASPPRAIGAWKCDAPPGAPDASAVVRVTVDAKGAPSRVDVLESPAAAVGAAARACALAQKYTPARGADGRPVEGTLKVRVRFAQ
jgi:biopolymer transport protein ExbD